MVLTDKGEGNGYFYFTEPLNLYTSFKLRFKKEEIFSTNSLLFSGYTPKFYAVSYLILDYFKSILTRRVDPSLLFCLSSYTDVTIPEDEFKNFSV